MLRIFPSQINDLIELLNYIDDVNLTLVEIGSYMGESMEIFAKSGKFQKIYCVDPWLDTDTTTNNVSESEKYFDKKKINYDFVEKIKLSSKDASLLFENDSIDVVYIDAEHTPKAIYNDITLWLPKIKKEGFISGHDWEFQNGILQKTIIDTIGLPDHICTHVIRGGDSDGSWIKNKKNIKLL